MLAVKARPPKKHLRFEMGDEVRVTTTYWDSSLSKQKQSGKIGRIVEKRGDDGVGLDYRVRCDDGYVNSYRDEDLELYRPPPVPMDDTRDYLESVTGGL